MSDTPRDSDPAPTRTTTPEEGQPVTITDARLSDAIANLAQRSGQETAPEPEPHPPVGDEQVPFPLDPDTGRPVPPPPTQAEEAQRIAKWRARKDAEERERASSSKERHELALADAKGAIARLAALEAANAAAPEGERIRGIRGVEYLIEDLTDERAAAASKWWNLDLEVIRDENNDQHSLTRWTIADIEDPAHRMIVQRFVDNIRGGPKRTLIIFGSVGTGKTACAIAAGHAAVAKGINTRYISHLDYLSSLRVNGVPPRGMSKHQWRRTIREASLLILDDFCAEMDVNQPAQEFVRTETMEMLNERIHRGRATIVTTNLDNDQVDKVMDDRLSSRMGMRAVGIEMADRDRRQPLRWGKGKKGQG